MSAQPRHLEISSRAERDLRGLPARERARIVAALQSLVEVPPPENLDVRALAGHAPWRRLRVGDHRVIYRTLTGAEQGRIVFRRGTLDGSPGFLVARVVNRHELERVVRTLEVPEVS